MESNNNLSQQIDAIFEHIHGRLQVKLLSIYPNMSKSERNDLITDVYLNFRKHALKSNNIEKFTQDNVIGYLITIAKHARKQRFRDAQKRINRSYPLSLALDQGYLISQKDFVPCEEELLETIDNLLKNHTKGTELNRRIASLIAQGYNASETAQIIGGIKAPAVRYHLRNVKKIICPHYSPKKKVAPQSYPDDG